MTFQSSNHDIKLSNLKGHAIAGSYLQVLFLYEYMKGAVIGFRVVSSELVQIHRPRDRIFHPYVCLSIPSAHRPKDDLLDFASSNH
jgi:hypothetical protein